MGCAGGRPGTSAGAGGGRGGPVARGEWRVWRARTRRSWRGTGGTPSCPVSICCGPGTSRQTFVRHTHEDFVIAPITEGVEVFHHRGADQHAGRRARSRMINPDTPHTGRAGRTGGVGVRSRSTRPPDVVAEIAAETTTLRGTVGLRPPRPRRPVRRRAGASGAPGRRGGQRAGRRHTAAGGCDAGCCGCNGGPLPQREVRTAGARIAARARAVLEERMAEPPTLERLAAELGHQPVRTAAGLPGRRTGCRPTPG